MSTFVITDLERQIEVQRPLLKADDPIVRHRAEVETERLEPQLVNAQLAAAHRAKIQRQREADAPQREAAARTAVGQAVMDDYRPASPGTTEEDARAALPELLHRHHLTHLDAETAAIAAVKRRISL
jgi:hypothetical protein